MVVRSYFVRGLVTFPDALLSSLMLLYLFLQCLNEFLDVTDSEKTFLNLWNRFARSSTVIPDGEVAGMCLTFIRTRMDQLQGLRQELLMHLINLWETRLIGSRHVSEYMSVYDELNEPINPSTNHGSNHYASSTTSNNKVTSGPESELSGKIENCQNENTIPFSQQSGLLNERGGTSNSSVVVHCKQRDSGWFNSDVD
jgi:VEFS-Box of polycomb protein